MAARVVEREVDLYVGKSPFDAELKRGEIGLTAWFNLLVVWRAQREEIERRTAEEIRAIKNRDHQTLGRLQAQRDRLEEFALRVIRGDGA